MTTLTICAQALKAWREVCTRLCLTAPAVELLLAEEARGVTPLKGFVDATEVTANQAGLPTLGWTIGEYYDFVRLGAVGRAIMTASTLGGALQRFSSYVDVVQDAAELKVVNADGNVMISYRILDPEIWPRQQDAMFTLAIVAQILRRADGLDWRQTQILLESDDAALAGELCRTTGIDCIANGDVNALRFPMAFMELPLRTSSQIDPPDYKRLNYDIARKKRSLPVELRVRIAVYRHLGSPGINQGYIAAELGMSTRTLRRRLSEEDVSFQEVVYSCRMHQAAQQFRLHRPVSVADLALRLGYSEHSAFTRAFSRWSGVSPRKFQQRTWA